MAYTIVRPTLVYDARGGLEFNLFLDYLQRFPAVPFIGSGAALKRPVYVEDIIRGLLALCGNPVARGKTYSFSGGEALTIASFARLCLALLGREKTPIVHLPVWLCHHYYGQW